MIMENITTEGGQNKDQISELAKFLQITKTLPEVVNGLQTLEQSAYNLAWNEVINQHRKLNGPVIYSAIGPDLITVLQVTNAQEIFGLDYENTPNRQTLENYINEWDEIKSVPKTPWWDSAKERYKIRETLVDNINHRRKTGYWDVGIIHIWGIEKCILMELKRMGIDRNTISLSEDNGHTILEFDWNFPGKNSQRRKVTYIEGRMKHAYDGKIGIAIPGVDCFYQKAAERYSSYWDMRELLKNLPPYINKGGVILLGRPCNSFEEQDSLERFNRKVLNSFSLEDTFIVLKLEPIYDLMMSKLNSDKVTPDTYGWQLSGFRKN